MADQEKKNIGVVFDFNQGKATLERGIPVPKGRGSVDDPSVRSYKLSFALNGGYIVEIQYDGTDQIDHLAFATKEQLIESLGIILK